MHAPTFEAASPATAANADSTVKLGVVGAGAIGLTLAAQLAHAHDIVVLARRADAAAALERDGIALIDDHGVRHVRVRAVVDARAFADRDAVIVAVKSYATADALAPLHGILHRRALVASVQNGIGNVELARATLPGARSWQGRRRRAQCGSVTGACGR